MMKYDDDDIEVHAETDNVSRLEPYLMSYQLGSQFLSKTTFVEQWRYKPPFHTRQSVQKQSRADDSGQTQENMKTKKPQTTTTSAYQGCLTLHYI